MLAGTTRAPRLSAHGLWLYVSVVACMCNVLLNVLIVDLCINIDIAPET